MTQPQPEQRSERPMGEPEPWRWRWVLYGVGAAMIGYGLWGSATGESTSPVRAGFLLLVAVAAHDVVLGPAMLLVGLAASRVLPDRYRGLVQGALIVAGALTLVALPLVGRFGADPSVASKLPRDYLAGWLIALAVVATGTLMIALGRSLAARRSSR